ncbi:HNH endonuclease, partial [Undibacterium sp. CY21W]|uniref:HNH endonuclease n=1 Tax=Undibacterium sp. CY21W TaxID=2762293 RepID=UPI00164A1636
EPLLGKFLSGDPLVQDPVNGQNYNRYSYVLNNPTNLTDPTGFADCIPSATQENFCQTGIRDLTKVGGIPTAEVSAAKPNPSSSTPPSTPTMFNVVGSGKINPKNNSANRGNIHLETAKTIGSAFAGSILNTPGDIINGVASWTEEFLHKSDGSFGRVGNLWDYRNPVAQDAAGDLRAVEGGLLMLTPLKAATSEIPTIGGRVPINSRYAGEAHPSGIEFNKQGFPDFGSVSKAQVRIDGLTGNYAKDAALANKAVGLSKTPSDYVWHHVEDGRTMQLVPKDVHNEVRHTGGAAVIRNGGFD